VERGKKLNLVSFSPIFFKAAADFRRWLKANHESASELWVGFHKKDSGKPGITFPDALDEALCFGWIDGIRKKIDGTSYTNRFTPRRTNRWSAVNIARAKVLIKDGRMQSAGLKAFETRDREKSGYSIAQRDTATLSPDAEKKFRANRAAWKFFEGLPPAYRRDHIWFVEGAKRPDTRARRLESLIKACAKGVKLDPMRPLSEQL
jgi:uncharacterized protein YdeI (YjbR/CyaY-like superfamily)